MGGETEDIGKICLEGDWSVSGVAQQLQILRQRLAMLLVKTEKPASPQLDLAGITELDACGCQLLALFVRNLRQFGIQPVWDGISQGFSTKISLLGFYNELGLQLGSSKDCP